MIGTDVSSRRLLADSGITRTQASGSQASPNETTETAETES